MTPSEQNQIIAKWVGTPYAHRECQAGRGVDCIHLVAAILGETGIAEIRIPAYPANWRQSDPGLFDRAFKTVEQEWQKVKEHQLRFGDVAVFKDQDGLIKHAAVVVDPARLIHVWDGKLPTVRIEPIARLRHLISMFLRKKK